MLIKFNSILEYEVATRLKDIQVKHTFIDEFFYPLILPGNKDNLR